MQTSSLIEYDKIVPSWFVMVMPVLRLPVYDKIQTSNGD